MGTGSATGKDAVTGTDGAVERRIAHEDFSDVFGI